jgi:hypothetical protein
METWGSGGIVPPFLTSALNGGDWSVPPPPPGGKSPQYPWDRRLGGPHSWLRHCGEEKNLALPGIKPGLSSPYPVAILTELS